MQLIASKRSIDLIILSEVSSEAYYNKALQKPMWPKGQSGVTIGVGYDLGHNTKEQIIKDLGNLVSPADLTTLLKAAGVKGNAANTLLEHNLALKQVKLPFSAAKVLFYNRSLPRYAEMTEEIYPGLEKLLPDAIGALVSIVYNRGAALAGDSRKEMKAIQQLVKNEDYNGIAAQIVAMKRLWVGKNLPGLMTRRDAEAKLVKEANRDYADDELLTIEI